MFIIVSTQRSGTHFLGSLISSNSQSICIGEAFHYKLSGSNFYQFLDRSGFTPSDFRSRTALLRSYSAFLKFRRSVSKPEAKTVGPIIHYNQLSHLPQHFFHEVLHRSQVIHLVRENVFRSHLSDRIGRTARRDAHAFEPVDIVTTTIDTDQVLSDLVHRDNEINRMRDYLSDFDALEVTYESLSGDTETEANRFLSHLGVDAEPLSTNLHKSNRGNVQETVENFAELEQTLKGTKFEQLIY